jgi:hypothetical protein
MIQYSLLGWSAALTGLNATFRGLAPSPSSGRTEDGDVASPRNVVRVFKPGNMADRPRWLYWPTRLFNITEVHHHWSLSQAASVNKSTAGSFSLTS